MTYKLQIVLPKLNYNSFKTNAYNKYSFKTMFEKKMYKIVKKKKKLFTLSIRKRGDILIIFSYFGYFRYTYNL